MNVFVAGATGVLGRRVVALLITGGHHVVGLSRSPANSDWLTQHGAEARAGDLFDPEQMRDLTADCDAVLHLATAIPTNPQTAASGWAVNDRIRREGTRNLVEAALHGRCQLYLQQSITLLYGDRNGAWVDENTPIAAQSGGRLQSAADMEQMVMDAMRERQLPAAILRFGSFYSDDSGHTRAMFEGVRQGTLTVIGDGGAYWNMIDVNDAASAVARVVDIPAAAVSHVFNVCDDEPVTYADLVDCIAQALGVPPPARIPIPVAEQQMGAAAVRASRASVRCRNELFKATLGWQPPYPTYREGIPAEIAKWLRALPPSP